MLTALAHQCDDFVLLDLQIKPLEHLYVLLGGICEPHPPDLDLSHAISLLGSGGHFLCISTWRWNDTPLTVYFGLIVHDLHHFLRGTNDLSKLLISCLQS